MTPCAQTVLTELLQGNERFRSGRGRGYSYNAEGLRTIALEQHPIAAIVACSDSRVSPEVIFDQPLGKIFSSRVPGNVASDSAKWMLEIALGEFKVPLVMILGHTGCLAVGQLLDGDKGGAGGLHRYAVLNAVYKAKNSRPADLYRASIEQNVAQTVEHLTRDLYILRSAVLDGTTSIVGANYVMDTGAVELLDMPDTIYGRF